MALILPFVSFLIGFLAVKQLKEFRAFFAMILAKVLIPFVIIYNMVFYQEGSIWLIVFSFICSLLMYVIFKHFYKNKLKALCLSYLNMAWLGFPFALAIFGTQASSVMVALYIGGSVFGNICAVTALSPHAQSKVELIKKVSLSPPILALSIAAVLSFWDFSTYQDHDFVQALYQWDKWLMTFTGMCILGMWLSHVKLKSENLIQSALTAIQKMMLGVIFCVIAFYILPIPKDLMTFAAMLMFFLLPPAANIVALETHYRGTGESAQYIASGTVMSIFLIGIYGIVINAIFNF